MATVENCGEKESNVSEFEFGDLVLAKVRGLPIWPAKVSRPEEHGRTTDPTQYFVEFFGTGELAFVGPADIQAFTSEKKIELSQGKSKPVRGFGIAVKEICKEFENLQHKDFSSIRDDGALMDEAVEVCGNDGTNTEGPKFKSEIIGMSSLLEGSQKQEGMERQDIIMRNLTVMHNTSSILTEEEGLCEIQVDGRHSNIGQDKFTYGHHSMVDMGIKKKFSGAGGFMKRKVQVGNNFYFYTKNLLNDRNHSEDISEDHNGNLSSETVKVKRGLETAEASSPSKMPKHADSHDTGMVKALGAKADHPQSRVQMNEASHSDEEDDLPLMERYRRTMKTLSGPLVSGNKLGKSVFRQNDLVLGNKIQSPVTQLPTKRRAVLICDDDDEDELPKSPIHVSDSNNKPVKHGRNNGIMKLLSSNVVSASKVEKKSLFDKNGLVQANKTRSAGKQPPTKRRTVILCDDEGRDELPKTPIHGGSTSKASDIPHVSVSKSKPVNHGGNNGTGKLVSSNVVSTSKVEKSVLLKNGLVQANKIRSPGKQPPTKRRTVILCDDEGRDELPKTPIHGGSTSKASDIPHVSVSKSKPVNHGGNNGTGKLVSSNVVSTSKVEKSVLLKKGLVQANKIRSAGKQPPTKWRTVILCDDEGRDELPKTPIHGGSTSKASDIPYVSVSKSKPVNHVGNNGTGKLVSRKLGAIDLMKEEAKPALISHRSLLGSKKLSSLVPKPVLVSSTKSPPSNIGTRRLTESQNKQLLKVHGNISQKKAPVGTNRGLSLTESPSLNRLTSETLKPASSGEKGKSPRSDLWINNSVLEVRNSNESVSSVDARFQIGKDRRKTSLDSTTPDSAILMKDLIAAALERKRQADNENSLATSIHDVDVVLRCPSPFTAVIGVELTNMPQLDVQGLHVSPINGHASEELKRRRVSSGRHTTVRLLTGGTKDAISRGGLERMLDTLSRTKESIGRATRLAIDCAKQGIATEVVELLVKKLENEPNLHRRVDFFFLVDSITQRSYSQKGVVGASFLPIIQSALPRLLEAAAPPGTSTPTQENRRQCHKVLRLWLERNILPECVLRPYMEEIRVENDDNFAGFRRTSRYERGVDDPIRYMEDMFVDEYGSNVTFPVPGLLPCLAFDDEEDEDDFLTNFDEVKDLSPPIHTPVTCTDPEKDHVTPIDQGHIIVGNVAGELEMEGISGQQKDYQVISTGTIQSEPCPDRTKEQYQIGSDMNNEPIPSPNSPPLPDGTPPHMSHLPTSPPPPLQQHPFPPQPYPTPRTTYLTPPPYAIHVPPLGSQPHQSAFVSQHRLPPPSLVQPYAQRRLRPECPPQLAPSQFSYTNSVQQYQYPNPYSFPSPRRNVSDEQWHMQVNKLSADSVHGSWSKEDRSSTAPYLHEGYFGPPTERRPSSVLTFQPSGPNVLPAVTPIAVRMMPMPPRPDMSTVNWRPA